MFENNTVYIIGDAKAPSNNPITQQYKAFFIGLVVNKENSMIVDADCSATIELTKSFVKSLLVGRSILDIDAVTKEIQTRYFGSSQKALIVAFKNASLKYQNIVSSAASSVPSSRR
ncbi:DUF3870 domain-containing protein [Parageobacillus sp. KH3-4]|jgi:hypothetical protein|uniref:DUF3870 domain-containing protein n=1 Tax=Parageobacillus sp. KH3-4 TaxID=2916802 RepID=UPI001FCCA0D4|nr:DUF3870 domain-containing protein [Parageobacillus sp. KH3-4]BDG45665.1 hypothetical protein PspKH34_02260 [Parageobacillus sp. KH3-4]